MKRKPPTIIEIDLDQLEALLRRLEKQQLEAGDYSLMRSVLQAYAFLVELVGDKETTIRRLRKLLFGAKTEKTCAVIGEQATSKGESPEDANSASNALAAGEGPSSEGDSAAGPPPKRKRKGHGRNGVSGYPGAERVNVSHPSLGPGDSCPQCGDGTLYSQESGKLIRIVGQAPLKATIFFLEKLRCHLCGHVFTAAPPPQTPAQKHDATAATMIALLKYGSGMPFNRLQGLQGNLGIPLPASTQWDVVSSYAARIHPAYEELIRQAAQGKVLHHDDTTVKILEMMKGRASQTGAGSADSQRSGLFTSGVVALCDGHQVALFFSGRQHAGENLAEVLKHRAEELGRPIQMCDASSRNMPEELKTILANCLAHGRRNFVDLYDRFPEDCKYVLEALKVVYANDAKARQEEMSAEERLAFHQQQSGPTMQDLKKWLDRQIKEKLVESNSGLGEAIQYMRNHWDKLTLFLRQAGAPLDNNICERALKKAILHRKNAYFYKSPRGAKVGDLYMSLIHTCELCGVNASDYLTALHRHPSEVAADPSHWMPWNYPSAASALAAPATPTATVASVA